MADTRFSLYVVRCGDGSLYTGIATDVQRRFKEHESGPRGARYLQGRGPLRLVYEKEVGSRSLASQLEHRVKKLTRPQKEALVAGQFGLEQLLPTQGVAGG